MTTENNSKDIFGLDRIPREEAKLVYLSVPWEKTVSCRTGTSAAPKAIFNASSQIDLYDLDVLKPYTAGLTMPDILSEELISHCDFANITNDINTINNIGEQINKCVFEETNKCLRKKQIPVIVGGEHSVIFGAVEAASNKYPNLGILQFDAHMDLRDAHEGYTWSHASITRNIKDKLANVGDVIQIGIRDFSEEEFEYSKEKNIKALFDQDISRGIFTGHTWDYYCDKTIENLKGIKDLWITFDIDALSPSLCPSTGTPVPGGLDYNQVVYMIYKIAKYSNVNIVGFDLVEVVPKNDIDVINASRLLYKLTSLCLGNQKINSWF